MLPPDLNLTISSFSDSIPNFSCVSMQPVLYCVLNQVVQENTLHCTLGAEQGLFIRVIIYKCTEAFDIPSSSHGFSSSSCTSSRKGALSSMIFILSLRYGCDYPKTVRAGNACSAHMYLIKIYSQRCFGTSSSDSVHTNVLRLNNTVLFDHPILNQNKSIQNVEIQRHGTNCCFSHPAIGQFRTVQR